MKTMIILVSLLLMAFSPAIVQAQGWTQIPGVTPDSPAAVAVPGGIYTLVVGGDGSPYVSAYLVASNTYLDWGGLGCTPANVFQPWVRISGWLGSHPSLVYDSSTGNIFILVQGGGGTIWRGNLIALIQEACGF